MAKVKITRHGVMYPMPMALIGAVVDGGDNFMPAAWVMRANMQPPMLAVSLSPHHTNRGINEHGQLSVNFPSVDQVAVTDYCGMVSGRNSDKTSVFETFRGDLEYAPMISLCPFTMECRVVETVSLPSHTLFITEVVGAYANEECLTNGVPDIRKLKPFTLTMPDNIYWSVGAPVGKAWSIGKGYKG
jgi:flavin reductase (DIM6/NTAB) family NADH-FMN oxidoreductase RutF